MLKYIIVLGTVFCTFFSCQNNQKGQNGPCDYFEFNNVKFKIVEIEELKDNPSNYNVWIEFEESSLAEKRQNMGELKNVTTDVHFIEDNYLKEGSVYQCDIFEIKPNTGNCEPLIIGWNNKFRVRE